MPETLAAPPTQAEPAKTAANISGAIQAKANGKAPIKTAPEAAKKEAPPSVQPDPNAGKEKYSVEGKEVWLTPEQARSYVQKGLAFEPRISELDRIKREVAAFEQALTANPGLIIANIAKAKKIPIQNLVENVLSSNASDEVKEATGKWYWENVAKRQRMDPKDLEILEKDERIRQLESADKAKAEQAVAIENRGRVAKALAEVSGQIQETLQDLGIKDVNSAAAIRLTKEIADIMRVSYFSRQPCTAKQAAEKVKSRILAYQRQFYDEMDGERLVTELGKENAEKVRKYFLKVVQEAEKGTQQESQRPAVQMPKRNARDTINLDQFHDYLDEIKRSSK